MTDTPPTAPLASGPCAEDEPRRSRIAAALRTLAAAALRFRSDFGFEKAASLAYSSLLALVPTALLAISVVELLDATAQDRFQASVMDLLLPRDADLRRNLLGFVQDARTSFQGATGSTSVRIVSVLMLFYFSASLLTTVDRVVAQVWGGGGFRAFVRRLSAYWAVITLGPVLLAASFAATALAGSFLGAAAGGLLSAVFPFVVSSVAIYLFYRLMPHVPVRPRAALSGAVAAGVLWEGSKLGLGWWFDRPHLTFLAKLSFFPMALLWMYVSWAIVIYGLEVAYVVHHGTWRESLRGRGAPRRGASREVLAVAIAIEVAVRFDAGRTSDRAAVASALGASEADVARALDDLVEAGIVAAGEGGAFVPARGADGIAAVSALRAVRGAPDESPLAPRSASAAAALAWVTKMESGERGAAAEATIGALARSSGVHPRA